MSNAYLETTRNIYREAALNPQKGLCCTTTPIWKLPELTVPQSMQEMNYGCGTTVHPRDLADSPQILYVGVGGGMELLQFAYFNRAQGGVVGIDPVEEMLEASHRNLKAAESLNPWFRRNFVDLRKGDALSLPVEDSSIDVAAQNCLFNVFEKRELALALGEMYRVLKPRGRLVLSDPICDSEMPANLRADDRLRALCLSGAIALADYIDMITAAGFGTVEVRARRPYRVLAPRQYGTDRLVFVESVEVAAVKDPMPMDGPCVFTGRTAIFFGDDDSFSDGKGHLLLQNQPLAVCDKTARALLNLGRDDIFVTESTYFYDGGGCC